jgi:predicted RNA-binding protein YlxR (DUF448 family)
MTTDLKQVFEIFSFKTLQEFETICRFLEREKIALIDLRTCIKEQVQKQKVSVQEESKRLEHLHKSCPECGELAQLYSISTPKGQANIYGWRSAWVCTNTKCLWQSFSKKSVGERQNKIRQMHECGGKANGTR